MAMNAPMFRKALVAAAFALSAALPAAATPASLRAAIDAMDLGALHREAASGTAEEKKLAAAVELAWKGRDMAAVNGIAAAVEGIATPELKAAALWQLFNIRMRRGEFAEAVTAGRAAQALAPADDGAKQALAFIEPLVDVGPTRAVGEARGRAPITRDAAGLLRADISANGAAVGAVLDTGANFSTASETSAKKLGLRMLDANVSVGSSTSSNVASRIGVADRLSIGGATFSNVVFIVLPDKDLSFAGGAYTIDAILGIPVFFEMGGIAVVHDEKQPWFVFGHDQKARAGKQNILFNALSPMASGGIDGAGKELTLMLDTGAPKTLLEARFAEDFPALLVGSAASQSRLGGAGGVVTTTDSQRMKSFRFSLGGKTVELADVEVGGNRREDRHGLLGLDALGPNFVIDLDTGRLELK
jgi:predicted aspartyl protease